PATATARNAAITASAARTLVMWWLLAPAARRALHHAEGTDRPAEAVDHELVDLLARRDALVDARVRFLDHVHVDAVGDEAPPAVGRVLDHHRVLVARGGELDDRRHGGVAGGGSAHDLRQPHHRRR